MLRKRVIPCLLLSGRRLVKTRGFRAPSYLGDPINIVKIFNEKEVDEIILIDIHASRQQREPDYEFIQEIASEAFVPVTYGGGIRTVESARRILRAGIEKLAVNAMCFNSPQTLTAISAAFGSQCLVAIVDVKRNWLRQYRVHSHTGEKVLIPNPVHWAQHLQNLGAGEILIQDVDRDGSLLGLDDNLIREFWGRLRVPWVAAGGAKNYDDISKALRTPGLSAVGVGAAFVYYGPHRAVLISYLSPQELEDLHQVTFQ